MDPPRGLGILSPLTILAVLRPPGPGFHLSDVPRFGQIITAKSPLILSGKPVAYNSGLLWLLSGLLWGIVASYFGLLGVPGTGSDAGEKDWIHMGYW